MNNIFFMAISGILPDRVQKIINDNKEITISVKGTCESGHFSILIENENDTYELEMPILHPVYERNVQSVHSAVANQKNIDLWIEQLTDNIKFFGNKNFIKDVKVNVKNSFVYKKYMFSKGTDILDKRNIYIVHPYMAENCEIEEIENMIKTETGMKDIHLKFGLWDGKNYKELKEKKIEIIRP